jgi:hypothetical protein
MSEYEIARWCTPGLTPIRLLFTSYGGSAHGEVVLQTQDVETGGWEENQHLGRANGIPETKGEKVSSQTINQFTGNKS